MINGKLMKERQIERGRGKNQTIIFKSQPTVVPLCLTYLPREILSSEGSVPIPSLHVVDMA